MHFLRAYLLAAIFGLLAVAHAASIQGLKHHHAHHVGAGATKSSLAVLSERDNAPGALVIELIIRLR